MFKSSKTILIESLRDEIKHLREQTKELQVQIIAMSNKAGQYYTAKRTDPKVKTAADVISMIDKKPATTPEQIQQKAVAKKVALQVLGGA